MFVLVADQNTINQAIIDTYNANLSDYAMPMGTSILLLPGTFNINGTIEFKGETSLIGIDKKSIIILEEGEDVEYPETDWWYLKKASGEDWAYAYFSGIKFTVSHSGTVPSSLKGLLLAETHAMPEFKNCDWYGDNTDMQVVKYPPITGTTSVKFDGCMVSHYTALGTLFDFTEASSSARLYLQNTELSSCAICFALGAGINPKLYIRGSNIKYSGVVTLFTGASTNIYEYGDTILKKTGTAIIPNGATYVDVTHGYIKTPTIDQITLNPTNSKGAGWWISDIGATTFRINVPSDPGATTATFGWAIS